MSIPCPLRPKRSIPDEADPVPQLRGMLGSAVFIAWPKGKKGSPMRWKHLTSADMTPQYVAKLRNGNIGVALGTASGGLCAIDIDDDSLVEPFLKSNPVLTNTFQTHGARGRVFWIRCKGNYPAAMVNLKAANGNHAGEFRSSGSQSIVWGIHPNTKRQYQWVVQKPVVEIQVNSIAWPECFEKPEKLMACIEESRRAASRSSSSVSSCSSSSSSSSSSSIQVGPSQIQNLDDVLRRCVATHPHNNNRLLFDLARGVKALEHLQGQPYSPEQLRKVYDQWHARSFKFLRPEQSKDDYWMEFLSACESAKYPLGGMALVKAWQRAKENPPPREAAQFENPEIRQIVCLCRELQILNGDKPFYLSSYTCQRLLDHQHHSTVATWLRALCKLGIIKLEERGNTHRASRYRYLAVSKGKIPPIPQTLKP